MFGILNPLIHLPILLDSLFLNSSQAHALLFLLLLVILYRPLLDIHLILLNDREF
jgi:hypothetical protein